MNKTLDYIGWIYLTLFTIMYYSVFICGITGDFGVCYVHYNLFNEIYLEAFIIGLSIPFIVRYQWKTLKELRNEN